ACPGGLGVSFPAHSRSERIDREAARQRELDLRRGGIRLLRRHGEGEELPLLGYHDGWAYDCVCEGRAADRQRGASRDEQGGRARRSANVRRIHRATCSAAASKAAATNEREVAIGTRSR